MHLTFSFAKRTRTIETILVLALGLTILAGSLLAQEPISDSVVIQRTQRPSSAARSSDLMERALVESYSLAKEFPPEQRIRHLIALSTSAVEVPSLSTKLRQWTEELYRIAAELPSGDSLRSRAQSAAVANMATVDAKRALQLFDGLEAPAKADTDSRPWVARVAFAKILEQQGVKAVPILRQRARRLGERGPYPYSAMVPVIAKLKDQPEKAQQIFSDALGFFRQNKDPFSSDMNFVSFLRGVHSMDVIPDWLMHEAAEELANHLVRAAESAPEPDPSGGFGRSQVYFHSALSVLQRIDPEMVASLKTQEPSLVRRSNFGNQSFLDERSARRNDPERAKLRARTEELMTRMMSMGEDGKGDSDEMRTLISEALGEGVRQAQRAIELSPDDEHDIKRNPPALVGLVRVASRISPEFTLQELQTIGDSELKAYMLMEFANAVQELNYMREMNSTPEAAPPPPKSK